MNKDKWDILARVAQILGVMIAYWLGVFTGMHWRW